MGKMCFNVNILFRSNERSFILYTSDLRVFYVINLKSKSLGAMTTRTLPLSKFLNFVTDKAQ